MKRYFAAAGALLLGTSTIALAADLKMTDSSDVEAVKVATDAKSVGTGSEAPLLASKTATATSEGPKLELASLEKDLEKLASAETGAKVQTASADKAEASSTGMGGPVEAEATATASLTPQPATQNYPPCDPGPGDDRCIQLYEEGVREQLASWNRPTGGLLDSSATTAMGGPYEPVDEAGKASTETDPHLTSVYKPESADTATGVGGPFEAADNDATQLAMNGDGSVDSAAGETAEIEAAASGALAQSEVGQHSDYSGVGGPVETQSGYPPCDPGPGDDRCIQLYEAGVSGAGN